ncbi:MAG: hypothetical protein ACRD8O_19540 [Bryobacteraceae bacterium]
MEEQPAWNFEQDASEDPGDETSTNLRAYFDRIPEGKLRAYDPAWTGDQVKEWDGNFRDDGALMLVCSERDVDIEEYREVLARCIRYRERMSAG